VGELGGGTHTKKKKQKGGVCLFVGVGGLDAMMGNSSTQHGGGDEIYALTGESDGRDFGRGELSWAGHTVKGRVWGGHIRQRRVMTAVAGS